MRASENLASFSAAVFSHAELAKYRDSEGILSCRPRSKSETSENVSNRTHPTAEPRKRKVASVVSLVSLERTSEEACSESEVASRDPAETSFLSRCGDSSGIMRLSFPMKLHWMLYECEMARQVRKRTKKKNANKKQKTTNKTDGDIGVIIGWLSGGLPRGLPTRWCYHRRIRSCNHPSISQTIKERRTSCSKANKYYICNSYSLC